MGGSVLVTGCATGLGLHVVQNLLARPDAGSYHYIFTVRATNSSSTKQLEDLVTRFNTQYRSASTAPTASASIKPVDLSNIDSIRSFAADINSQVTSNQIPPLHSLILNAGISWRTHRGPERAGPDTDLEAHFQVNHLANLTLSLLLLESLDKRDGRIVYVSSWAHDSSFYVNASCKPEPILWKDNTCEQIALVSKWPEEKADEIDYGGTRRYGASKMWLIMGMLELQRQLQADPKFANISVVGIDPGGNLRTSIARHGTTAEKVIMSILGWYVVLFAQYVWPNGLWRTEPKTANDIVAAGLDQRPAGQDPYGLYLNGSEVGVIADEGRDEAKQRKLWDASLKFAGLTQRDTVLTL